MDKKEQKRLEKEARKQKREAEKQARKEQKLREKTARDLRRLLLKYAREERFAERFATAVPLFWNELYTLETADEMDMNESFRFFDWYIYDYQPDDEPTILAQFAEEQKEEITVLQQELLQDWLDTPASTAYVYEAFDGFAQEFKLRDLFTDEELIAFSGAGTGRAMPNDLILTRVVPVGTRREFSTVAAYIPKGEIENLREDVLAAREAFLGENEGATHDDFMREKGTLMVVHHALAQSEAKDRYPVARLDPKRIDKAAQRAAKKVAKKVIKRRRK